MTLRECTAADVAALAEIFRAAVLVLGRQEYTDEQTKVWARHAERPTGLPASLAKGGVVVCAVVDDAPVAFGQLLPEDHVEHLYCHPDHARQGHAAAILDYLEAHAGRAGVRTLWTEASCVARSVFEGRGYRVVEEERPVRDGVEFLRFKMRKDL